MLHSVINLYVQNIFQRMFSSVTYEREMIRNLNVPHGDWLIKSVQHYDNIVQLLK